LSAWVDRSDWCDHLAIDPATRSNTSVCLKFADTSLGGEEARALGKRIDSLLEAEDAAYDINAYRDAPPGLRIWCGATVDTADIEALGPWLDWAFHTALQSQDT
jgi:phosphoserine aminotransferase